MSFTRFHDDPARIKKENIETSALNDYIFNVPGNTNGVRVPHFDDPHLRLQKGGGHVMTDMVGVETMLRENARHTLGVENFDQNDLFEDMYVMPGVYKSTFPKLNENSQI